LVVVARAATQSYAPLVLSDPLPSGIEARFDLLAGFIGVWFPPSELAGTAAAELDAAEERLGLRLPLALRRW
jgi:hypothetical protein